MEYCEECGKLISYEEYYDNNGICDDCYDEDEYWYWWLMGY